MRASSIGRLRLLQARGLLGRARPPQYLDPADHAERLAHALASIARQVERERAWSRKRGRALPGSG